MQPFGHLCLRDTLFAHFLRKLQDNHAHNRLSLGRVAIAFLV
jgi:hypothetical protein